MGYQRQIGYLTYYRGEERQGNCGFLRLEQKEEAWLIRIQVQKLPLRQELAGRVVFTLQEGDRAPEEILLKNGQGVFQKTGVGKNFGGIKGVCIRLGGVQELRWGESGGEKRRMEQQRVMSENQEEQNRRAQSPEQETQQEKPIRERRVETENSEIKISSAAQTEEQGGLQPERNEAIKPDPGKGVSLEVAIVSEENGKQDEGGESACEVQQEENRSQERLQPEQGTICREKQLQEQGMTSREKQSQEQGETPLAEEKWQQLSLIYPHRQPFGDARDYLAIGPSDFVVLTEESFRMANNSFLLHGYYRFGHLVLCRTRKKGETVNYIGVPGHYTDREKQAAILYGFESFESEAEPASEGDFGYYLLRVRL